MTRIIVIWTVMTVFLFTSVSAQKKVNLTGRITDEFDHPLSGATVISQENGKGVISDRKGNFSLSISAQVRYVVQVSFLGYETLRDTVELREDMTVAYKLQPENKMLREVYVTENFQHSSRISGSLPIDVISKQFLSMHQAGSLMQTLGRLPGISSMDIGAGQSKPVIRGLGFNRVVVAENGIKHEAQEWGTDHGLEIDQFIVERVELIKGPASLMYGGNAIGGVIDLKQIATPATNSSGGNVRLNLQSNHKLAGVSAGFFQRHGRFYSKGHFTYTDYSDYKVPVDSIEYMSYYFRLKDKRLRNTAGNDRNGGVILGYLGDNITSHLSVTNNFSRSGFFANAHGLEIRNSYIDFDRSDRDIDLPSQKVNHFKVLSNTIWMIKDYKLNIDLGFQHNNRHEFSEAVEHGYMPLPPDSLERLYDKSTLSAGIKVSLPVHSRHAITTGLSAEHQYNTIGGWGFMLPEFSSASAGAFVHDNIRITQNWQLSAGLRYDRGYIHTNPFYDWYETPSGNGNFQYIQRAAKLDKSFGNFSWGIGSSVTSGSISYQINLGKSFRMPTAKELSSNGINYHMYRYEKGDTTIHAEESYQLDLGMSINANKWQFELTPFINYFPNYIYLNPTSEYQEAQQVYYYSQSEVFRSGAEMAMAFQMNKEFRLSADLEYIYSIQLSGKKKGYTLPFSPPLTTHLEFIYAPQSKGMLTSPSLGMDVRFVTAQNNIVPPEKKTPGYTLISLNGGASVMAGKQLVNVRMQLINVFNTRYFDHTSFYRLIGVPGQGRNMIISIQLPLGDV